MSERSDGITPWEDLISHQGVRGEEDSGNDVIESFGIGYVWEAIQDTTTDPRCRLSSQVFFMVR